MSACIICEKNEVASLYPSCNIVKCANCGLVFADVDVANSELAEIYGKDYFAGEEYANYVEDKEVHQKNFRRHLQIVKRFSSPGGKLLEIGCAYGHFLELAKDDWEVYGVDVSKEACGYAKRELSVPVFDGEFLDTAFPSNHFDIVCLWDTIEHVPKPHLYFKEIERILKVGGCLCLTTGDIGSLIPRLRGEKWRLIHPPSHLFYFSQDTMSKLLSNYNLKVAHVQKAGFSRSLEEIAYGVLAHDEGSKLKKIVYNGLRKNGILKKSIYLNLYDIMFVIAFKQTG